MDGRNWWMIIMKTRHKQKQKIRENQGLLLLQVSFGVKHEEYGRQKGKNIESKFKKRKEVCLNFNLGMKQQRRRKKKDTSSTFNL